MGRNSRERILAAAADVLVRNPFASLEDIAEAADLGRATLYRYFASRDALIKALTIESFQQFEYVLQRSTEETLTLLERFEWVIRELVPIGARYHFLSFEPFHSDDPEIEAVYARYIAHWRNFAIELQKGELLDRSLPLEWIATSIDGLIFMAWENVYKGDIAPNKAADFVLRTLLHGLVPNQTRV